MTTNADITIFNQRYIKTERTEKFVPTVIRGVYLYFQKAVSGGSDRKRSDSYTIRIPADADTDGKAYVGQKEYAAMDDETCAGYWTLQPGTLIVRGVVDLESATETELMKAFQDVITVANFLDNRSCGSKAVRHWRIGGE